MRKITTLIIVALLSLVGFAQDIATARSQGIGATVTVTGIVTNGNEFYSAIANCIQGSVYIKDIRVNAKIYVKSKSFILDKTVKTIQKYLV